MTLKGKKTQIVRPGDYENTRENTCQPEPAPRPPHWCDRKTRKTRGNTPATEKRHPSHRIGATGRLRKHKGKHMPPRTGTQATALMRQPSYEKKRKNTCRREAAPRPPRWCDRKTTKTRGKTPAAENQQPSHRVGATGGLRKHKGKHLPPRTGTEAGKWLRSPGYEKTRKTPGAENLHPGPKLSEIGKRRKYRENTWRREPAPRPQNV